MMSIEAIRDVVMLFSSFKSENSQKLIRLQGGTKWRSAPKEWIQSFL